MREKLEPLAGQRLRFRGVFSKYGVKSSYKGLPRLTLILVDVEHGGVVVTDHLWFNWTKGFQGLGLLCPGDVVAFDARVETYWKGYLGDEHDVQEKDYHLTRQTRLKVVMLAESRDPELYQVCAVCGFPNDQRAETCRRCRTRLSMDYPVKTVERSMKKRLEQMKLVE